MNLGDTNSMWGNMYFGISQALAFGIAGIPYFGVETCGFNGNADMELCTRWMQLSAWFPFYVSCHYGYHTTCDTSDISQSIA